MLSSCFRRRAGGLLANSTRHLSQQWYRKSPHASSRRYASHTAAAASPASNAVGALAALAAAASCSTALALAPIPSAKPKATPEAQLAKQPPALGRFAVADAVDTIAPSVVKITRTVTYPKPDARVESSGGSGFIYERGDGMYYLITNAHVVLGPTPCAGCDRCNGPDPNEVEPMDEKLDVTLFNGDVVEASLVGADSISDVAVLSFEYGGDVSLAELRTSGPLRPGEFVVVVGTPSTLQNSCNFGIVSNIRQACGDYATTPLVQVDAAVNPGSSGSPVADLDGHVCAVVCSKLGGNGEEGSTILEGISFGIPIDWVEKCVKELRAYGRCRQPYVGVSLIAVDRKVVEDLTTDSEFSYLPSWLAEASAEAKPDVKGLLVHSVDSDSPASSAKLRRGDVVIAVNGKSVHSSTDVVVALAFSVGDAVELEVRRPDGKIETVELHPTESGGTYIRG